MVNLTQRPSIAADVCKARRIKKECNPVVIKELRSIRSQKSPEISERNREIFHRSYQDLIRSICVLERSLQGMHRVALSKFTPVEIKKEINPEKIQSIQAALHQSEKALENFSPVYSQAA